MIILSRMFLIATIFMCSASDAETIVSVGVQDLTRGSYAVVWVRLSDRRPVEFRFEQQTLACGFLYTATVVEATRGSLHGGESFDFFTEYDAEIAHGPLDYFVIVYRNDPEQIPDLIHEADQYFEGADAERAKCRARALARANYRVPAGNTAEIAPAVTALSDKVGAPWFARSQANILDDPAFAFLTYASDGVTLSATSWDEIKRVLPRAERRPGSQIQ